MRYLRLTSLTWTGVLGTPAVLAGVGAVAALQLAFTYLPPMQALFGTRPVALRDGLAILGDGVGAARAAGGREARPPHSVF